MTIEEQEKSALVVLVPEADSLVGEYRRQFDLSATFGLGSHITVLFPFKMPARISREDVAQLRQLFLTQSRFNFTLTEIRRFPSAVYLAPEPAAMFSALTHSTTLVFPDYPPYGGAFSEPLPHLTVAQTPLAENLPEVETRIRATVGKALPLSCATHEVSLVIKSDGRWSVAERFELGGMNRATIGDYPS